MIGGSKDGGGGDWEVGRLQGYNVLLSRTLHRSTVVDYYAVRSWNPSRCISRVLWTEPPSLLYATYFVKDYWKSVIELFLLQIREVIY